MTQLPNLMPALPEMFTVCGAMVLLILGVTMGERSTRTISLLSVLVLVGALVLLPVTGGFHRVVTFHGLFVIDRFALFMKGLALVAAILALIMSVDYNEREGIDRFEFPILILLSAVGMMMMISANDLMALYVGLELLSLSLYVLAAFRRDSLRSTEAGLKYFVLGAVASGMLLYGSSLVYGFAGTTGFTGLAQALSGAQPVSIGVIIGLVFVMAGLAFKVSAVPFHMWTPDVYEGAPTPVTAYFAVGPKIAAIALFLRVMIGPFGHLVAEWQQVVVVISIASMALGAFAAIGQSNIKRLMAYSSIGHVGYALIGLATGTVAGIRAVLIYMAIYLFMNVGTFAVILSMRVKGKAVEGVEDLAGLSKTQPVLALALMIFMFSMAGIPPLAGFFGKLYVFLAAIEAKMYTLAILGVLTSVVSAYYYLRIVKVMYFDDVKEAFDKPVRGELTAVLVATGFVVLFFFLYPMPLLDGAAKAAASLFVG